MLNALSFSFLFEKMRLFYQINKNIENVFQKCKLVAHSKLSIKGSCYKKVDLNQFRTLGILAHFYAISGSW